MDVETQTAMVAMLSASFALVKPAGLTPKETKDWARVAFDCVNHIPLHIFEAGCRAARLTCTHHSQIVPAIVAETKQALEWHNRPKSAPRLHVVTALLPKPEVPRGDPECMMASLKRMGLEKGWLVKGPDGRLIWAEDSAA